MDQGTSRRGTIIRQPSGISVRELERRITTLRTTSELRAAVARARAAGRSVGLVPTMGSLHEGHLSLVRRAAEDCGLVIVSLFVNPAQFGPGEDYRAYPRDEQRDAELAAGAGAEVLFAPSAREVYPPGFATAVDVEGLMDVLCGAPGSRGRAHFRGVATVVTKLLNMCAPDVAYFGQKDYQQSLVIRRVVSDLDMPVRIEVCPTVREPDGLALSSRNAYLTPAERERATALSRALRAAEQAAAAGAGRDAVAASARAELDGAGVVPEYIEILRAEDLGAPAWEPGERVVVAIAARIGRARLIDNTLIELPAPGRRDRDRRRETFRGGPLEPAVAG
jgi:pantoate--beta-alanine ligase